jgi:diguanylate cyclase (GGDEF)-like protein
MDSMISLKKHLEAAVKQEWSPAEPGDPALEAFHALLLAAGSAGHRAVPDLGPDLRKQLTALAAAVSPKSTPEVVAGASQRARHELSQWAEQAFLRYEASERDLRQIVEVMASGIASVARRDERTAREFGDLTRKFRAIATLSDLAVMRRCILEQANALTTCVARIAEESSQTLERLRAEVDDYRARLTKSEELSSLDPLTGLKNRRSFETELAANIRSAKHFSLILIDLDGFKDINDRFGHLAGDEVLKHFGARLQRQFPSADLVARWGGDEFAVIITSGLRDAESRVRRIRRAALGEYQVTTARQAVTVAVDASIGVVEWDGNEDGPEMLARADRHMYASKESAKTVRVG